jgi:hypothetical protein
MSLGEKTQCLKCPHERYEHIDWKLDTSYANNHTGCRIAGCECAAFDTTTVRMADESYCEYLSNPTGSMQLVWIRGKFYLKPKSWRIWDDPE